MNMNRLATIALSATLLAGGAINASAAPADAPSVRPWFTLKACAVEDDRNCAWDASKRGNGEGESYATRTFRFGKKRVTCVMFERRAFARTNDVCFRGR